MRTVRRAGEAVIVGWLLSVPAWAQRPAEYFDGTGGGMPSGLGLVFGIAFVLALLRWPAQGFLAACAVGLVTMGLVGFWPAWIVLGVGAVFLLKYLYSFYEDWRDGDLD